MHALCECLICTCEWRAANALHVNETKELYVPLPYMYALYVRVGDVPQMRSMSTKLKNVFSHSRMCSLTKQCVLSLKNVFS
jgi:hypothetical protein